MLSQGRAGGALRIPKEASLDNVSFLHFLTAAPWGMTNAGKMLLTSRDKNYDYLLGCHPPWGILARDITPLFLLVPRARRDPDCSMVKGLSCLLTPCFQTVPLVRAARDVSCPGLLCPLSSCLPGTPHGDTNNVLLQPETKGKK